MCNVYLESPFGVRHLFSQFETEEEANKFCAENNWSYLDENEFEWSLVVRDY